MNFLLRLAFICTMLMFAQNIFAQQYFFTNYTVDDGLSSSEVICIVKDSEGFIWTGTNAGLNRFNGYDFTVYKSLAGDSTTLSSNNINGFLVDHGGNLWIGTAKGICRYNKNKNNFIRIPVCTAKGQRVSSFESFDLFEDSKKNIWACVAGYDLVKFNAGQNCFEEALSDIPPLEWTGAISAIEDTDGSFWIASYTNLVHFYPSTDSYQIVQNILSGSNELFQALSVFPDSLNKDFLWIATWGSGLVHFNKLTGKFVSYKFRPLGTKNLHNIVFDIYVHDKNKLWLATNEGIIVFDLDKKMFERFVRDSINADAIINTETHCIYRDDEAITWIGSVSGLCNIHPAKQNFVNQPLWLNAPVRNFYYDEQENKMYGLRIYFDRSLIIYDRKKNKEEHYKIPQADELRAEPFSVLKDNNGLIWIATTRGIYTFDESQKKFSLFNIEKQLHIPDRSIYVRQVLKDNNGNLWFSCYSKGLLRVDANTKKITSYLHDEKDPASFPLYAITGMAAGKDRTIYICDDRLGAVEFEYGNHSWTHFNAREKKYSALYDAIDIAADHQGCIWITTRNNGLVCIDKSRETVAYVKDDFGNIIDEQSTIAIDDSGNVWLTASNGIYRFNPSVKSFTSFTLQDGLPYRTVPLYKLSNGKIAIQIPQGIFCFDPLNISKTVKPLQVHLTSLLINGKPAEYNSTIDRLDTITLNHTDNNLTLEFAATDFAYPSSALYSYKLEGTDNNWSVPAKTRTVNFSHLSPGDYRLRIRAGENFPEKKIFIRIIPAWWQTNGFRWLSVFTVVGILFFSIRYYLSFRYRQKIAVLQRQREIESIRMRISRDIHDEIGSGLTKIKLMSRNLLKTKEENALKETTAKISYASDELIQNLGEIVWTINPANDTLENVFGFVRNYVAKLFDGPDIKLKLNFTEPEKIPHVNINPEVKRNLLLILKESLTNIFKHAQATEVSVALLADASKIELQVSDNGKGMGKENQNGFGNGLKNMQRRAESINASFRVDSGLDKGTTIRVVIPLGKS